MRLLSFWLNIWPFVFLETVLFIKTFWFRDFVFAHSPYILNMAEVKANLKVSVGLIYPSLEIWEFVWSEYLIVQIWTIQLLIREVLENPLGMLPSSSMCPLRMQQFGKHNHTTTSRIHQHCFQVVASKVDFLDVIGCVQEFLRLEGWRDVSVAPLSCYHRKSQNWICATLDTKAVVFHIMSLILQCQQVKKPHVLTAQHPFSTVAVKKQATVIKKALLCHNCSPFACH